MDQSLDDLIQQDSRNSRKRNSHSGNRNRNFQNNRGYRDNNNYDGSRSRNSYRENRSSHGRHGRHGNRYDNDNNNYHDYNNNSNDYYNNRDNSRSYRNRHRNHHNHHNNNDNYNDNDDYRFDDMTLDEFNDFNDEPPRKRARTNTYRQRYNNYNNNNNNNRNYRSNNNNRNDNGYYNDNRNEMPLSHRRQSPWIWHAANNRHKEKEDKNELLKRMINGGTFAYATLVMKGDGYVGGALMLGYSLKLTKTKYKLIVMVTNDVSKDARNALSLIYDYVIEVPFIEYSAKEVKKLKTEKQAEKYNTWMCASFTKWNVLQLNELITNENNGYERKEGEIEDSNGIENEKEKEKEKENENESKDKSKESKNGNDDTTEGESNDNQNENENDNGNDTGAAAQSNDKEKENENDDSEGKEKTEANDESSKTTSKEKSDCNENESKKDSIDISKRKESKIDTIGGPFDRILFLDCDKVVISNIDDIFLSISQCPGGTFSSPWACHGTRTRCKYSQRGINDFYNEYRIIENDIIPRECLYDGLMNNGFVAVGTGMLFEPNIDDYNKFVKMLANGDISDAHAKYNKEKLLTQERQSNEKSKENENKTNDNSNDNGNSNDKKRGIGFSNCYSMSDEQTIVYYYFSQGKDWSYIDVRYNFIPWKFEWLDHDCLINEDCVEKLEPVRPFVLHFFGGKPWVQSPSNYGDLQSWWSLAYHLLNKSDICVKNEENCKLLKKFFEFKYLNELPIMDKEKSENENEQGNGKKKGTVECFWCKEKRPRNDDRKNHYSFSPLTGKWCDNLANGIKHVAQ